MEREGERGREREGEIEGERERALLNLEMSSKHCGRANKEKAPQKKKEGRKEGRKCEELRTE